MTATSVRPRLHGVSSSWHPSAADLPADRHPATPFHTAEWAAAWQLVRTEQISTRQHLLLTDGPHQHRMAFAQVHTSPLWRALETAANVPRRTFDTDVLCAPSLYSLYGGLPGARGPVLAEAVERGHALARELGSDALMITNLPPAERTMWREARFPDAEIILGRCHRTRLSTTLTGFLARIPASQVRNAFRAAHRRGQQAGLTLTVARGPELLSHLPQLTGLLRPDGERAPSVYGADMIASLTRVPGAVGLLAQDGARTHDGYLAFHHGRTLYLWAAASGIPRAHTSPARGWLMYETVKYAIASGVEVLDIGRDTYPEPARLGMLPVALTSALYLTRDNPRLLARLSALQAGLNQHLLRSCAA
ncbi:hypothetical protein C9F11_45390 (plasmid) [Streptomyces sp. YIM 121038]|uniref:GNAT family N-acetyltransferase n=1 Tax=Streptomyces sp. YIM 121038 TaxID=2136401 RepID=UPI00111043C2|nr:GNAT family N-acetyltransferase [Streptomyces sp. YIM 121038]QCX82638.1 hypothetical protein C9F11_45390 [Streptomyces sp. YIM 121038]